MKEENEKNHPNLKPWKPGQSGNPKGPMKGSKSLKVILREYLDKEIPWPDIDGKDRMVAVKDIMAEHVVHRAINDKDVDLILRIASLLEDKPTKAKVEVNIGQPQRPEYFMLGGRLINFTTGSIEDVVTEEE